MGSRDKMQRKNPSREDYISDLPQSITETILTKLPLRDAVRTSVLSSEWRYNWATITDLEFDDQCVSETHYRSLTEVNLVKFITRFLLLHDGPINRFALRTDYLQSDADIDQWLLFLSRKGVKELVFELRHQDARYKAPSCFFSYQKLVRLELIDWELDPPLSFKGFPSLKHLKFDNVYIAPDAIHNLISTCPLLESLNILNYHAFKLTIRAANLMYLVLEGGIDICFENTPKLVAILVTIRGYMAEPIQQISSCNLDKFFGGVPSLERLVGCGYFVQNMSVGITFGKTHMTYQQLKVIELDPVRFGDTKEIMVVLKLILNAPNLQELQIWGSSDAVEDPDFGFWERECQFDSTFEQLKVVKMKNMPGVPHAVKFIGFLLGNSPVLETMRIIPCLYITDEDR